MPVPLLPFAPPTWTGCGGQPAEEVGSAPARRAIPEVSSVEAGRHESYTAEGDPLEVLRERLADLRQVIPEGLELPRFIGGAVGVVGYDWVRFVEDVPDANPDDLDLPDLAFVFPEIVIVYDNVRHTALLVRHARIEPDSDPKQAYQAAVDEIQRMVDTLRQPMPAAPEREQWFRDSG